jgi:hypothetical protein
VSKKDTLPELDSPPPARLRPGLEVLLDSRQCMATPLGRCLKRSGIADRYLRGGEAFAPLVRAHRARAGEQGGLRRLLNRL